MAETYELELDLNDRFQRSRVFIKGGHAFFGLWRPLNLVLDGDEDEILVQDGLDGQLGTYAEEFYGDERLWWVIAQVNLIDFPPEQVVPGLRLVIPKSEAVNAALLATVTRDGIGEVF